MSQNLHRAENEYLVVTNPILLWLFRHGWEDPNWGTTKVDQAVIASAIYAMSDKVADAGLRKELRSTAAKAVGKAAEAMTKEA